MEVLKTKKSSGLRTPSIVDRMGAVLLDSESAFRVMIHERTSLLQAIVLVFSIAFLAGGLQIIHLDRILRWLIVVLQPPYSNLDTIAPGFVEFLREVQMGYPRPPVISLIIFGGAIVFALLYVFFVWFLWASISFILARIFFRGTGTWRNDLVLFGYCSVVDVFTLFVGLLMLVAHPGIALISLLVTPLFLLPWKIVMAVQALKENHGISTAHAFYCVFLIPIGAPLLLVFVVAALAISFYTTPLIMVVSMVRQFIPI